MLGQQTFAEMSRDLKSTTFVIVDLETTGIKPNGNNVGITEIGAVKVRGGEVIGEFATLINPESEIPPFITVLTGINHNMVINQPTIREVLPSFLEFCGSPHETVLIAHNAPFDIGFLKTAAKIIGYDWPGYEYLDTVKIARSVLRRDEIKNYKLSTLASHFNTTHSPTHRALDDSRTTNEIFHRLLESLGSLNVTTVEDLNEYLKALTPDQRSKRTLIQNFPNTPGIYIFRDARQAPLYIGKATNLRSRVRSYFTGVDTRKRMAELIHITVGVDYISLPTEIESHVREIRMIAELQPPYNRVSKFQERAHWVTLTKERIPKLRVVRGDRNLPLNSSWIGPFSARQEAYAAIDALHELLPLRQCSGAITASSQSLATPCALYEMGKCGAPCNGTESVADYSRHVERTNLLLSGNDDSLNQHLVGRMRELSNDERFEEAQELRDRHKAFVRGASRGQRIRAIVNCPLIIAALPQSRTQELDVSPHGGPWEIVIIKHGRLAGSTIAANASTVRQQVELLKSTAEVVQPIDKVLPASHYQEVEALCKYLENTGIRIVEIEGTWALPTFSSSAAHFALEKHSSIWEGWLQSRFD